MKSIKIKLDANRTLDAKGLDNINQYTFQDGVIDLYVKSDLIIENKTDISMVFKSTKSDGIHEYTTKHFYLVKANAQWYNESNDYTLYEMRMPKIFTLYSGTQCFSVVVDTIENGKIVSRLTTADYEYEVKPSGDGESETIDPSDVEDLQSQINSLESKKQDKTDENINVKDGVGGTYHTVVGSLNTLSDRVDTNVSDIATRKKETDDLTKRVSDLESKIVQTFHFIGSLESDNSPNESELNDYVKSHHETLHNGDSVLWVMPSAIYLCIYANGWTWNEITGLGKASNDRYGVVKGNSTLNASGIAVELSNGEFKDIRVKIGNGDYALDTWLNKLTTEVEDIEKGNIIVKESQKATYDSSNNNIVETYMTKNDGATKSFVYDYALPKTFNDIYYVNYNNMTIGSSYGGTLENSYAQGQSVIARLTFTNGIYEYKLSRRNNVSLRLYYSCLNVLSKEVKMQITMNVFYKDNARQLATCSVDLPVVDTNIHSLDITTPLSMLGDDIVRVVENDNLIIQLIINNDYSQPIGLCFYSNETYLPNFQFTTDLNTMSFTYGKVGEINSIYVKNYIGYDSDNYEKLASAIEGVAYNLNLTLTEGAFPYMIKVLVNGSATSCWLVISGQNGSTRRVQNEELFELASENDNCLNVIAKFIEGQFVLLENSITNKRYTDSAKSTLETSVKDLQVRVSELELKPNMRVEDETMYIDYTETQVVDEVLDI